MVGEATGHTRTLPWKGDAAVVRVASKTRTVPSTETECQWLE